MMFEVRECLRVPFNRISNMSYLRQLPRSLLSLRVVRGGNAITRRGNATAVDRVAPKVWKREEIQAIYDSPLMGLIFRSVRSVPALSGQFRADPTFSRFPISRRACTE